MSLEKLADSAFNKIFENFKENVTLRSVTKNWDSHDDTNFSYSESTVEAVILPNEQTVVQEHGSQFKSGDIRIYFKPNVSVKKNDQLIWHSEKYEITEITPDSVDGDVILQEATGDIKS